MLPFLILLFLNPLISAAQVQLTIPAQSGKDITLPCQAPNSNNFAGVEWSRRDLEPEYVLLFRDGHFVPEDQQPSFKDRVELQDQQMKNGDVSLILKNVTTADRGTYECRVLTQGRERRKRAVETIRVINLIVNPSGQTGGHTEDGGEKIGSVEPAAILSVSAVLLLLLASVVGFVIYRKRKPQQSQKLYQPPAEQPPV